MGKRTFIRRQNVGRIAKAMRAKDHNGKDKSKEGLPKRRLTFQEWTLATLRKFNPSHPSLKKKEAQDG